MISYFASCLVVAINVIVYVVVHLILELYYLPKKVKTQNLEPRPQAWKSNHELILTTLPSIYLWFLLFVIPLSVFLKGDLFYSILLLSIPTTPMTIVQLIGLVIVSIGTVVAISGRISRGKDAISWGIPKKIIERGIFKYIRHPLYSSYILLFIGLQLTYPSLVITPLLFGIPGYYLTTKHEEELLIETFGDQYSEYKTRTNMFFPLLF